MAVYEVYVSVNITPKRDEAGWARDSGNLMFSRKFEISGDSFTDLAPKIDSVHAAIEQLADKEVS